ncbi:MAG: hypothetical protein ACK4ZU_04120 [Allorhizobium sp.]
MSVAVTHIRSDGTQVLAVSQRSGECIVRGKDRKGIRAGDWKQETGPNKHLLDQPQVEKARILVETAAVVGADELTAQDIACHEYLLACARLDGIDKPKHQIVMRQMCDYLGVAKPDRVWCSLERLMRTLVRYHIVDPRTSRRVCKPLIDGLASSTNRLTGTTVIDYSIPGVIRDAILQSRSYTWLDINVFPKFRSKYSARLYPKLALMAGYDFRVRKPWTPTLPELAAFLGYSQDDGDIHFTYFNRVLDKALAEIAEHVTAFEVVCVKPRRGSGRGRPVPEGATFHFRVSDATKSLWAHRPADLGPAQIGRIEDRRYSPLRREYEHPPVKWFAQAQTMTAVPADELSDRWRRDLSMSHAEPTIRIGAMTGALLTSVLDAEGLKSAFRLWVGMAVMTDPTATAAADVQEFPDALPRCAPGNVAATWIEEEVWYADGYTEDDEMEDLRLGDDFELGYGEE